MLKWLRQIDWTAIVGSALVLSFCLLVLVPVERHYEPNKNQSNKSAQPNVDHRTPDERLADYTLWLERFTGLLAAVSGVQIFFLIRADRASKIASDRAEKATRESMDLAERQFTLEGARADTALKEIGVIREQYFAAHRPKLEIKFIKRALFDLNELKHPTKMRVEFSIINVGDAEARIVGSRVHLATYKDRSDIPGPDDLPGQEMKIRKVFAPSARDRFTIEVKIGSYVLDNYLIGWIVFSDARGPEFGTIRTTYFCFNDATGEMLPVQALPDWNFTS